jgi:hypothetical protein
MCKLADVRGEIQHGDLLLFSARWRPSNFLIARAGRSLYVHAGRVAWEHGELRLLDTVQGVGGRNISLRDEVERHPGAWQVWEPRADVAEAGGKKYSPAAAVDIVREHVGQPYGWRALALAALVHLPILRLYVRPAVDDASTFSGPPFCSHLQALADRLAGFDPVPYLADRLVEPGDLARSIFYRYRFTLEP